MPTKRPGPDAGAHEWSEWADRMEEAHAALVRRCDAISDAVKALDFKLDGFGIGTSPGKPAKGG